MPPSIKLAGFIRHYLFLDLTQETQRLRLFPDGSMGIALTSAPTLQLDSHLLPNAFFYGQITEYKELSSIGPAQLVVIVFHPHAINHLLDLPANAFNDRVVPLETLFAKTAAKLHYSITAANSLSSKLAILDDFFLQTSATQPPVDPLITQALHLIYQSYGTITVQQLTHQLGCQTRQLERKFEFSVGLSPKRFSSIIRTLHFVKSLQANDTHAPLTDATYESGYYDQAHGIKAFRKATGLTPSTYLKHANPLALNFLVL